MYVAEYVDSFTDNTATLQRVTPLQRTHTQYHHHNARTHTITQRTHTQYHLATGRVFSQLAYSLLDSALLPLHVITYAEHVTLYHVTLLRNHEQLMRKHHLGRALGSYIVCSHARTGILPHCM